VHTAIVIAAGFGLFAACALAGHLAGGEHGIASAALVFMPLWLVGAAVNLYLGVKGAGYSVAEEAPIFAVVFAVPAAVAVLAWWRLH
jgi:hypothetical protein